MELDIHRNRLGSNYPPLSDLRWGTEGPPVDDGAQRIASRSAALEFVRSHPDGLAGALVAIYLDKDFKLLAMDRIGEGNAAECGLRPMHPVKRGHELGAAGFVLVHHAPERTRTSPDELSLTKAIKRAGEDFDILLFDHLIMTSGGFIEVDP